MLFLIIIGFLLILGFILLFIGGNCDVYCDDLYIWSGGALVLVMIFALVCIVPDIISAHIEFDYIKEKYYNLERQINTIEYDDIVTDKNLRNQVLEMNNTISEHKVKSKNIWVGDWYSEEIGNIKPLEWKSKKYNTTEK